jgi:lipopolysaccharide biosynthesis glycosyltransferase
MLPLRGDRDQSQIDVALPENAMAAQALHQGVRPPRRAIVLVCDMAYLLASLVCAAQARAHTPSDWAVYIYLDGPPLLEAVTVRIFAETGVEVCPVPAQAASVIAASAQYQGAPGASAFADPLRRNRLSRASLLRLEMGTLVADRFDVVLYLDGDMQVRASLAELLAMPVQPGRVIAVKDWNALHAAPGMPCAEREIAALSRLGFQADACSGYINTGMMLADIATWRTIGARALAFYNDQPEVCRYYDQCALNAVLRGFVDFAPQRFNFLRFYLELPISRDLDPAIVHFCYRPKPWDAPIHPWGQAGFAPYADMNRRLRGLNLPWPRRPWWEMAAHDVRARTRRPFADPAYRDRLQRLIAAG